MKPVSMKTQLILVFIPYVNIAIPFIYMYNSFVFPMKYWTTMKGWFFSALIAFLAIQILEPFHQMHQILILPYYSSGIYCILLLLGLSLIYFQKKFGIPYSHTKEFSVVKGNFYSKDGVILIRLKKRVSEIKLTDKVMEIGNYACQNCKHLKNAVIPQGVTRIGQSAFEGCTALTEAIIPPTVTSIGEYVFSGCHNLTALTLPFVGENAKAPKNLPHPFGNSPPPPSLKTVTLQEGCAQIGEGAFDGWKESQTLYIAAQSRPEGWDRQWRLSCHTKIIWGASAYTSAMT